MNSSAKHSFHIPVMGTSYTIDTPIKTAHLGISSVISLVDDMLIERMRKYYCKKFQLPYEPIGQSDIDRRAKRTRAYLNLVQEIVNQKFEKVICGDFSSESELTKYFELLPDNSPIKAQYELMLSTNGDQKIKLQQALRKSLVPGAIDVNIMTKLDRANYVNKTEKLPVKFNDAHASLRGFAQSELNSTLVLSAGLNPSLYAYLDEFKDFYPDQNGHIKKKIALKVSDYRSALIQGKMLAKKGIWVSEFRIESGLNCGGHAFATEGHLLGPILEEFKSKRNELASANFKVCQEVWSEKGINYSQLPQIKITIQGGIGTAEEQQLLLDQYQVDSTGWGSPFLLVPEVCTVDGSTLTQLSRAKEEDLYLSDISPLGIPFNTIKGNTKDDEKQVLIDKNRPGSACPKEYLALIEYNGKVMCTASRQYQDLKIKEINQLDISLEEKTNMVSKVTVKSCLCTGLAAPAYKVNDIQERGDTDGVSICPGPNLAYFDKVVGLKRMVDHIYGRANLISDSHNRPHMFVKELGMYVKHLQNEIDHAIPPLAKKQQKHLINYRQNLLQGIAYYRELFRQMDIPASTKKSINNQLLDHEITIQTTQIPVIVES